MNECNYIDMIQWITAGDVTVSCKQKENWLLSYKVGHMWGYFSPGTDFNIQFSAWQ